jgi:hypothetical protein
MVTSIRLSPTTPCKSKMHLVLCIVYMCCEGKFSTMHLVLYFNFTFVFDLIGVLSEAALTDVNRSLPETCESVGTPSVCLSFTVASKQLAICHVCVVTVHVEPLMKTLDGDG